MVPRGQSCGKYVKPKVSRPLTPWSFSLPPEGLRASLPYPNMKDRRNADSVPVRLFRSPTRKAPVPG